MLVGDMTLPLSPSFHLFSPQTYGLSFFLPFEVFVDSWPLIITSWVFDGRFAYQAYNLRFNLSAFELTSSWISPAISFFFRIHRNPARVESEGEGNKGRMLPTFFS